jgi:aryl-alcohol dehydrogenase-like predicted oxidoreductase
MDPPDLCSSPRHPGHGEEHETVDFKERVPLGRTGVKVSRIGLASGYGVPAASIEKAYEEHGTNYLYLSPFLNMGSMVQAIRNLVRHRDDLFVVLARPIFKKFRLERYVDRWLEKLGLEWIDLLFQDVGKVPPPELFDRVRGLQDAGKVRHLGISSHNRPHLGRIARGETMPEVDFFHVRYNAVHVGAEKDVYPHLQEENRPGVVVFTATCWRKLLKPKLVPEGEKALTAAECYRFVLSNPDVNVCITAPSSTERMEENFKGLEAGPLDAEAMARIRRIGKHIYGK